MFDIQFIHSFIPYCTNNMMCHIQVIHYLHCTNTNMLHKYQCNTSEPILIEISRKVHTSILLITLSRDLVQ